MPPDEPKPVLSKRGLGLAAVAALGTAAVVVIVGVTTRETADARFRFTPSERRFLLGALKGEGLLFARGERWPIKIEASPAEHRLATTNPRELIELAEIGSPASVSANGVRADMNGKANLAVTRP